MATVAYYSTQDGRLLDVSTIESGQADYHLDKVTREAQVLANECGVGVAAWARDDAGEQVRTLGVTVQPALPQHAARSHGARHKP